MAPPNGAPPGSEDTQYIPVPVSSNEEECQNTKYDETRHHKMEDTVPNAPKLETELLDSSDSGDSDVEVIVPPDGGWGWVVVAASFMCNMVVDGIIFSFGFFLTDIANSFGVLKTQVALVGSLMSGFYLIAGPFVSALANRYGFNLVAIGGSIFAALAFALSYFATNVTFLCISFGILGGIGFGLIYVPAVITVGFYFERWRALATGIGVCGSGIGTFLFAPLSQYLITQFGWRSALLCQGAIVLTCVIFGAMFRPLKPKKLKEIEKEVQPELIMDPTQLPTKTKDRMEAALQQMTLMTSSATSINRHSVSRNVGVNNNSNYPTVADVYHTIHTHHPRSSDNSNPDKRRSIPLFFEGEKPNNNAEDGKPLISGDNETNAVIVPKQTNKVEAESEINRPLYRDDIFFSASLTRLPQYTSKSSLAYTMSVTHLPTKNDIDEEKKHRCKLCPEAVWRTLSTMLDFSLLKSPSFILLSVSGFFTMMGFYVPFMFLVERATHNGMHLSKAVWLVSSIGIANTIGRVLCGALSSFPGVDALFVNNVALTIGGIATFLSGLSSSSEYQFTYTVVFGLSIACFASLRSIIVVDLMGLERLTNAFGLLLLFQGIAAVIGSPLAGAFMEFTGSYNASFYFSGGLILASAIMSYPLNCINRWERRRDGRTKSVPV